MTFSDATLILPSPAAPRFTIWDSWKSKFDEKFWTHCIFVGFRPSFHNHLMEYPDKPLYFQTCHTRRKLGVSRVLDTLGWYPNSVWVGLLWAHLNLYTFTTNIVFKLSFIYGLMHTANRSKVLKFQNLNFGTKFCNVLQKRKFVAGFLGATSSLPARIAKQNLSKTLGFVCRIDVYWGFRNCTFEKLLVLDESIIKNASWENNLWSLENKI